MIRVLIVDDSNCAAMFLEKVISADPDFKVVGTARNGGDAILQAAQLRPDVITMDINMPNMDGFDATRRIMAETPCPIMIVSSEYSSQTASLAFKAIEAGALAIVSKPVANGTPEGVAERLKMLATLKSLANAKARMGTAQARPAGIAPVKQAVVTGRHEIGIIAIGASTGGPQAVQAILSALPAAMPVPVVIVQHITAGYETGFADWLNHSTALTVRVASGGEALCGGHVYIAPTGQHCEVIRPGKVSLVSAPAENGVCPSVSRLFRSVAAAYREHSLGIILSGMGIDGAAELKQLRDLGAVTIAQDRDSSAVYGMPGEAIRLGGAAYILPAGEIAPTIRKLFNLK